MASARSAQILNLIDRITLADLNKIRALDALTGIRKEQEVAHLKLLLRKKPGLLKITSELEFINFIKEIINSTTASPTYTSYIDQELPKLVGKTARKAEIAALIRDINAWRDSINRVIADAEREKEDKIRDAAARKKAEAEAKKADAYLEDKGPFQEEIFRRLKGGLNADDQKEFEQFLREEKGQFRKLLLEDPFLLEVTDNKFADLFVKRMQDQDRDFITKADEFKNLPIDVRGKLDALKTKHYNNISKKIVIIRDGICDEFKIDIGKNPLIPTGNTPQEQELRRLLSEHPKYSNDDGQALFNDIEKLYKGDEIKENASSPLTQPPLLAALQQLQQAYSQPKVIPIELNKKINSELGMLADVWGEAKDDDDVSQALRNLLISPPYNTPKTGPDELVRDLVHLIKADSLPASPAGAINDPVLYAHLERANAQYKEALPISHAPKIIDALKNEIDFNTKRFEELFTGNGLDDFTVELANLLKSLTSLSAYDELKDKLLAAIKNTGVKADEAVAALPDALKPYLINLHAAKKEAQLEQGVLSIMKRIFEHNGHIIGVMKYNSNDPLMNLLKEKLSKGENADDIFGKIRGIIEEFDKERRKQAIDDFSRDFAEKTEAAKRLEDSHYLYLASRGLAIRLDNQYEDKSEDSKRTGPAVGAKASDRLLEALKNNPDFIKYLVNLAGKLAETDGITSSKILDHLASLFGPNSKHSDQIKEALNAAASVSTITMTGAGASAEILNFLLEVEKIKENFKPITPAKVQQEALKQIVSIVGKNYELKSASSIEAALDIDAIKNALNILAQHPEFAFRDGKALAVFIGPVFSPMLRADDYKLHLADKGLKGEALDQFLDAVKNIRENQLKAKISLPAPNEKLAVEKALEKLPKIKAEIEARYEIKGGSLFSGDLEEKIPSIIAHLATISKFSEHKHESGVPLVLLFNALFDPTFITKEELEKHFLKKLGYPDNEKFGDTAKNILQPLMDHILELNQKAYIASLPTKIQDEIDSLSRSSFTLPADIESFPGGVGLKESFDRANNNLNEIKNLLSNLKKNAEDKSLASDNITKVIQDFAKFQQAAVEIRKELDDIKKRAVQPVTPEHLIKAMPKSSAPPSSVGSRLSHEKRKDSYCDSLAKEYEALFALCIAAQGSHTIREQLSAAKNSIMNRIDDIKKQIDSTKAKWSPEQIEWLRNMRDAYNKLHEEMEIIVKNTASVAFKHASFSPQRYTLLAGTSQSNKSAFERWRQENSGSSTAISPVALSGSSKNIFRPEIRDEKDIQSQEEIYRLHPATSTTPTGTHMAFYERENKSHHGVNEHSIGVLDLPKQFSERELFKAFMMKYYDKDVNMDGQPTHLSNDVLAKLFKQHEIQGKDSASKKFRDFMRQACTVEAIPTENNEGERRNRLGTKSVRMPHPDLFKQAALILSTVKDKAPYYLQPNHPELSVALDLLIHKHGLSNIYLKEGCVRASNAQKEALNNYSRFDILEPPPKQRASYKTSDLTSLPISSAIEQAKEADAEMKAARVDDEGYQPPEKTKAEQLGSWIRSGFR